MAQRLGRCFRPLAGLLAASARSRINNNASLQFLFPPSSVLYNSCTILPQASRFIGGTQGPPQRGPATYHLGDTPARLSAVSCFLPRSTFHVHLPPAEQNNPWFPVSRLVPRSAVAHFHPDAMPMVASFRRIWPSMFTRVSPNEMFHGFHFPSHSTIHSFPLPAVQPYSITLS